MSLTNKKKTTKIFTSSLFCPAKFSEIIFQKKKSFNVLYNKCNNTENQLTVITLQIEYKTILTKLHRMDSNRL